MLEVSLRLLLHYLSRVLPLDGIRCINTLRAECNWDTSLTERLCVIPWLTVRTWEPEHAIVAHSPWLCVAGKKQIADFLDSAFDWLIPQPAIVEAAMSAARWALLLIVLPLHTLLVFTVDLVYERNGTKISRNKNGIDLDEATVSTR